MRRCGGRTGTWLGAWGRRDISLSVPTGRRGEKTSPSSEQTASALAKPRAGPGRILAARICLSSRGGGALPFMPADGRRPEAPWEFHARPAGGSPSIPVAQLLLGTSLCLQQVCGRAGTYAKYCQGETSPRATWTRQNGKSPGVGETFGKALSPTALPPGLKFHHRRDFL